MLMSFFVCFIVYVAMQLSSLCLPDQSYESIDSAKGLKIVHLNIKSLPRNIDLGALVAFHKPQIATSQKRGYMI